MSYRDEYEPNYAEDKANAREWARGILADDQAMILDTETTGLSDDAELVQIAVIDVKGAVLLDTLVKPGQPIPPEATRIHGITDADVATAMTWPEMAEMVRKLLRAASRVVIYNAEFDTRIMEQTCKGFGLPGIELRKDARWSCAMHWYSQWCGDWSDYHGNYRWQRLPGGGHSALSDAQATLKVIQRMAAGPQTEEASDHAG